MSPRGKKQITRIGSAKAQNTWLKMLNYQDYENDFNKLNITKEEGITLLEFLEALALIGIEYHENNELKKELNYD